LRLVGANVIEADNPIVNRKPLLADGFLQRVSALGRLLPFTTGKNRPKAAYQKGGPSLIAMLLNNVKQATSKTRSFNQLLATGIFSWRKG